MTDDMREKIAIIIAEHCSDCIPEQPHYETADAHHVAQIMAAFGIALDGGVMGLPYDIARCALKKGEPT